MRQFATAEKISRFFFFFRRREPETVPRSALRGVGTQSQLNIFLFFFLSVSLPSENGGPAGPLFQCRAKTKIDKSGPQVAENRGGRGWRR